MCFPPLVNLRTDVIGGKIGELRYHPSYTEVNTQDVHIENLIVGYLLYWLTSWGIGFVGQLAVSLYFKVNAETISSEDLAEIEKQTVFLQRIPVKWYLRPLFGYPPTSGTIALRVGVFQIGAILFAVLGLIIAYFIGFEQLRFLRQILLWPYFAFLIGVGEYLNRKRSSTS